ncbi:unnamed protein product [Toxocara canis]|uniref:39S ribosomal protein L30, mitochondrial n=1 Tax=Toxocara canis TaxID=6265 RepID=A0A183UG43_TOXCA|nr:unnamed protein product [Toxocara canis]
MVGERPKGRSRNAIFGYYGRRISYVIIDIFCISDRWVYKPHGRWYRYLPRRNEGVKEFNYESEDAGPDHFPEKMDGEPPKLWLAWIYRNPTGEPHWTKTRLKKLFGENFEPGQMEIFKNTAAQNAELWHVKHLIELRPLTFPNGEPTIEDVTSLEIFADGCCVIDRRLACDETQLRLADPEKQVNFVYRIFQMSSSYLSSLLASRYHSFKDVFEDNVYTPSNISVLD